MKLKKLFNFHSPQTHDSFLLENEKDTYHKLNETFPLDSIDFFMAQNNLIQYEDIDSTLELSREFI